MMLHAIILCIAITAYIHNCTTKVQKPQCTLFGTRILCAYLPTVPHSSSRQTATASRICIHARAHARTRTVYDYSLVPRLHLPNIREVESGYVVRFRAAPAPRKTSTAGHHLTVSRSIALAGHGAGPRAY